MKLQELLNPRVSYQVLITFDLVGAESQDYRSLRDTLAEELELGEAIHLSNEDGGGVRDLPYNTLATLWQKDATEQETRTYFEERILAAFKLHRLSGRYVIVVAQNWSVAGGEF